MPDMYDKLGKMLNEALESGKIPTPRHCEAEGRSNPHKNQNDQITEEKTQKSGHFSFNEADILEKEAIPTGEVIKLHKYTYNIQFSPQIQNALTTLDVVYPFTTKDITTAYHKKLKEIHPDTKNTIQTSKDVQNIRQYTVDEIKESYKILCNFFDVK